MVGSGAPEHVCHCRERLQEGPWPAEDSQETIAEASDVDVLMVNRCYGMHGVLPEELSAEFVRNAPGKSRKGAGGICQDGFKELS